MIEKQSSHAPIDRRSFSGDREHDELGSEMEDERGVDDRDNELDDPGSSER